MQQSPLTLRQRLIDAVDERYHVKDMAAIVEVLGTLERLSVTKELLETTRLGKTVNEFRKRINNEKLAKRAKALVKKWRDAVLEPTDQSVRPINGNSSSSVSEGPGPGINHGSHTPLSSFGSLQHAYASGLGYNSTSSSPKLTPSSKVSPSGSQNSNSLSPRILAAVNSNSNNSRNGSSTNTESLHRNLLAATANLHHLATVSSPSLNPASLRVSSPSTTYANKTKSPFGPSSSVYQQSSNKSPLSTTSSSYAPNSEIVARTNAANKRLRIDEDGALGPTSASGPPSKKARTVINGTGIGGTLDDPLIFDELSKDSIISRASDNSDGSSSKPVSNVSSVAVLSAAPSPIAATQDSNLSPPLSVGIGANSSGTICSTDKSSLQATDAENSIINTGIDEQAVGAAPAQTVSKRGRKKKPRDFVDSESLLREQIAKAKAEGKIRTIERLSREALDDEQSRSPDFAEENLHRAHLTALNTENPVIKNEIVEKYLQSQNELRAHMERQYQDAVARNEFPLEIEDVKPAPGNDDTKVKPKKKKDKKRDKKDSSTDKSQSFPTESEILARLPPIDPQILADFEDYVYYENPESEEDQKEPKSDKETENLINKPTSLSLSNQQPNNQQNKFIGTKIDWGDSDEDDDFEEVKIPETNDRLETSPIPTTPEIAAILPVDNIVLQTVIVEESMPLREVEDSEVERLHTEKIDNLNGNKDKDGQFREWHETLTVESVIGDLHILPYTIIDF